MPEKYVKKIYHNIWEGLKGIFFWLAIIAAFMIFQPLISFWFENMMQ